MKHCIAISPCCACRSGLSESTLRILTPTDVAQHVLAPLSQPPDADATLLQALVSQLGMSVKQAGDKVPVALDLLLLDCALKQACTRVHRCSEYTFTAGVADQASVKLTCVYALVGRAVTLCAQSPAAALSRTHFCDPRRQCRGERAGPRLRGAVHRARAQRRVDRAGASGAAARDGRGRQSASGSHARGAPVGTHLRGDAAARERGHSRVCRRAHVWQPERGPRALAAAVHEVRCCYRFCGDAAA